MHITRVKPEDLNTSDRVDYSGIFGILDPNGNTTPPLLMTEEIGITLGLRLVPPEPITLS